MAEAIKAQTGAAPKQVIKKPAKEKADKPLLKGVDLSKPTDANLNPAPAPVGHNVPMMIPEVVAAMLEDEKIEESIKAARKAQGDIRSAMKTNFNIPKKNWQAEKQLRKLDRDVRIQFESQMHDLKGMLGFQASLDLNPGTLARTEEEYVDPSAVASKLINRTH